MAGKLICCGDIEPVTVNYQAIFFESREKLADFQ